jgi:hypothetical protein
MTARLKFQKKPSQFITAVRIALDTRGLVYRKWGSVQRAKRGDWLVDNDGEVYTVDADSFRRTYRRLRPGVYLKVKPVWAEVTTESGRIRTREGWSTYRKGDYLVYNQRSGGDAYCIGAKRFRKMYRRAD